MVVAITVIMKKSYLVILFYLIACPLIVTIHKLSPTNLAGLGFDVVVYFVALIVSIILLANSIKKVRSSNKPSYFIFIVTAIGTLMVTSILYYVFTRKY